METRKENMVEKEMNVNEDNCKQEIFGVLLKGKESLLFFSPPHTATGLVKHK